MALAGRQGTPRRGICDLLSRRRAGAALAAAARRRRARNPDRPPNVGTYQGLGSLALLQSLPADGAIATFDVVPYQEIEGHVFRPEDFADGRLTQVVADITIEDDFSQYAPTLRDAELVFVDAAKDGRQARVFLERFEEVGFRNGPIVVFDDIRVYNMLQIWRDIRRSKLDITSFGHWSGTGLVDYQQVN